jgi:hypothetical protein
MEIQYVKPGAYPNNLERMTFIAELDDESLAYGETIGNS